MKFKLIKDIKTNNDFEEIIFYNHGFIFEPNDENLYILNINDKIKKYSYDYMKLKSDYFVEIVEINSEIVEIDQDEDNKIKDWRIQLDVKTSKNKLLMIQKFINENISEML